jgi:hypothetical protein
MPVFDTKQLLAGLAGIVIGGLLVGFWRAVAEWRKPVLITSEEWTVEYSLPPNAYGQVGYDNMLRKGGTGRFHVKVRFFNRKPRGVGLHKFAVVFSQGGIGRRKWFRNDLLRVDGLARSSAAARKDAGRGEETVDELTLVANAWTAEEIEGYSENIGIMAASDSAWLTAETAEGKKHQWLLHAG